MTRGKSREKSVGKKDQQVSMELWRELLHLSESQASIDRKNAKLLGKIHSKVISIDANRGQDIKVILALISLLSLILGKLVFS